MPAVERLALPAGILRHFRGAHVEGRIKDVGVRRFTNLTPRGRGSDSRGAEGRVRLEIAWGQNE